jgi:hypothetical protein
MRHVLLEALAEQDGLTIWDVLDAYHHIPEFKRRIDIAALSLSCAPVSQSIH